MYIAIISTIMQLSENGNMNFIGRRHNTKDDVKLKIYQAQIKVRMTEK